MSPIARASQFFQRDVWVVDVRELPAPQQFLYRVVRVVYLALRGFMRDHGLHRASALSFDTVLGLVPSLAFGVALLKSLGVYDDLIKTTVRPWIMNVTGALGDHGDGQLITLRSAFFVVLDFVDRADLSSLGLAGFAVMLYITVALLVSVETSLNHIFAAESARNLARRISDYAAILFITPISLALAGAITAHAARWPWLAGGLVLQLGAVLIVSFAFSMLYVVMPFTRVRIRAAALGGAVAGLLWYGVLALHVTFQVGVARYNALYSTFAAVPLFLIWLFMSWVVVLFGAELAAAFQSAAAFRYRVLGGSSYAGERFLALQALVEIGSAFLQRERPPPRAALAAELGVPERPLRDVLERLVGAGLLIRAAGPGPAAYAPAADMDVITVAAVAEALEGDRAGESFPSESPADQRIAEVLAALRETLASSEQNLTLRELVERSKRGQG